MNLRCTGKLLKVLGVPPRLAEHPTEAPSDLDWHANLLWFDRRKCLLVTHTETLFSVFIPDVRKPDMTPIGPLVVRCIEDALLAEALPANTLGPLDPTDVPSAKTSNRVVLGCMNDMAWLIENDLMVYGGLVDADIESVNHRLRRAITARTGTRGRSISRALGRGSSHRRPALGEAVELTLRRQRSSAAPRTASMHSSNVGTVP